jgi:hypothetical protein
MTIEIHKPELERMVQEEIASGHFRNVDDLLTHALQALRAKAGNGTREPSGEIGKPSNPRRLVEIFSDPEPIWKPEDHPEIDDAGEWVLQMRLESDHRLDETH